jgi:hypothetical protein
MMPVAPLAFSPEAIAKAVHDLPKEQGEPKHHEICSANFTKSWEVTLAPQHPESFGLAA